MNLRSLEFLVQEAFTGIRRNGLMAFASVSTIALSLGVLGAFVLVALGANNFASSQMSRFEIAVFVKDPDESGVSSMAERIRKMSGVASVSVRDRDREWAQFKRRHPDIESAGLPLNVLPYALDVKVSDPERLPSISAKIRAWEGVDSVKDGRETLRRVMAVVRLMKVLSMTGVVILLVATIFIISNAIKLTLYARRREIRIMQLVGATNQFIRLPLVIEGMVFGAVGALVAWVLLRGAASYLGRAARSITPLASQFAADVDGAYLALGLLAVGVAIGAAGSFVSIRRFLHD